MIPFVAATLGAIAMALAFPRANAVILAPLGAAGLFWAWFGMSPKRAFWTGWLAGTVYFGITFWWFGETAGALIAPFGFLLAMGPAIGDAFFGFALVGALVSIAARALAARDRTSRALVPLATAAIFGFGEWFRSEGLGEIGVPFGSLGYTQVRSPLAPLASYVGTYGVTFFVCVAGAYLAYAIRMRAVRGDDLIRPLQREADAGGDGLLPDGEMHRAAHLLVGIAAGDFLLDAAVAQHVPEERAQRGLVVGGFSHGQRPRWHLARPASSPLRDRAARAAR